MEHFILKLKDSSKRNFLLELLRQLDFVELQISNQTKDPAQEDYDFFKSAGFFENRVIDANQLRQQAWRK